MINLDKHIIEVECPKCSFYNKIFLKTPIGGDYRSRPRCGHGRRNSSRTVPKHDVGASIQVCKPVTIAFREDLR